MGNYRETFEYWKNDPFFDDATRAELAALTDEREIEDRFYRDLEFGTGGLRGVMGAGTNRMNRYTVRRRPEFRPICSPFCPPRPFCPLPCGTWAARAALS